MVKLFSHEHTFEHPFHHVTSAFWRKYPNESSSHLRSIDAYDRKLVRLPNQHIHSQVNAVTHSTSSAPSSTCNRAQVHINILSSILSPQLLPPSSQSQPPSLSQFPSPSPSMPPLTDSANDDDNSTTCLVTNRIISVESSIPQWLRSLGVHHSGYAIETSVVNPRTREMIVKSVNLTGQSLLKVEETCTYSQSTTNPNHTHYTQSAQITAFLPLFANKCELFTLSNMHTKSQNGTAIIERLCERMKRFGVRNLLDDLHCDAVGSDIAGNSDTVLSSSATSTP